MEIEAVGTPVAPRRGMSLVPEAVEAGEFGLLLNQMHERSAPDAPAALGVAAAATPALILPADTTAFDESPVAADPPEWAADDDPALGVGVELAALAALTTGLAPGALPVAVPLDGAANPSSSGGAPVALGYGPKAGERRARGAGVAEKGLRSSARTKLSATDAAPRAAGGEGIAAAGPQEIEPGTARPTRGPEGQPVAEAKGERLAAPAVEEPPAGVPAPASTVAVAAKEQGRAPIERSVEAATPERPVEVSMPERSAGDRPAAARTVGVESKGRVATPERPAEVSMPERSAGDRPAAARTVEVESKEQGASIERSVEAATPERPAEVSMPERSAGDRPVAVRTVGVESKGRVATPERPVEVSMPERSAGSRPVAARTVEVESKEQGAPIERPAEVVVPERPAGDRPVAARTVEVESKEQGAPIERPAEVPVPERPARDRPAPTGAAEAVVKAPDAVSPQPFAVAAQAQSEETQTARPAEAPGHRVSPASPTGKPGVEGGAPQARHGVERLWGYWLRRGNLAPGRVEAPTPQGGAAVPVAPGGPERRTEPTVDTAPTAVGAAEVSPQPSSTSPAAPVFADPPEGPPSSALASSVQPPLSSATRGEAAPVAASEPRAPAPAKAPVQQVLPMARLSLSRRGERVTVQLDPESLGKVQLVVTREGPGVVAHFRVETAEAQRALVAEAPLLRRELEAQGVSLVRVSVDMEDGSGNWHEPRTAKRNGRRGAANYALGEIPAEVPDGGAARRQWGFDARV